MFKFLVIFFSAVSIFCFPVIHSKELINLQTAQVRVQNCINQIRKLPEVCELMEKIQKEGGAIRFAISDHPIAEEFKAYWDVDQRVICVSASSTSEELIESLIFEMHNASANLEIEHFNQLALDRKIDRGSYIRSIEYIEFKNVKKASAIVEKGVKLGIFPANARLHSYRDFEEHYYYQKIGHHSDWIGKTYDELTR